MKEKENKENLTCFQIFMYRGFLYYQFKRVDECEEDWAYVIGYGKKWQRDTVSKWQVMIETEQKLPSF